MNTSGEAAQETFRMVIDGTEFVLKITGSLVKETATMLYAISKDNQKTSIGKTNLAKMLRNCKDTKLFAIQRKDLDKFVQEAKKYGIYYCVLLDKNNKSKDSIVDIMVRGDDASRVNRLIERYELSITDTASLRTESIKENEEKKEKDTPEISVEGKNTLATNDKLNEIMGKIHVAEEEVKQGVSENFLSQQEPQLEYSFKMNRIGDVETLKAKSEELFKKPSVRKQLKDITEEMNNKVSKKQLEKGISKKFKNKKPKELKR